MKSVMIGVFLVFVQVVLFAYPTNYLIVRGEALSLYRSPLDRSVSKMYRRDRGGDVRGLFFEYQVVTNIGGRRWPASVKFLSFLTYLLIM